MIENKNGKFYFKIKVIANAKIFEIQNYNNEYLRIKINAPAVEGKANKLLIEKLSEFFDTKKSSIIIEKGKKSHDKIISIPNQNIDIIQKIKQLKKFEK